MIVATLSVLCAHAQAFPWGLQNRYARLGAGDNLTNSWKW
jgi:hypothetical protein